SCPDVATVYMLIRPKKGKSVEERFNDCFNNEIFDVLRKEQPNFISKIMMIEADAVKEDFGLSPEARELLNDTNIVIHSAASIKFNEKLRILVHTNVRTTKQLLLWANSRPNLK
ncbi:fatty acyl-CoA reductase 1-like, partial [Augochlora pura]